MWWGGLRACYDGVKEFERLGALKKEGLGKGGRGEVEVDISRCKMGIFDLLGIERRDFFKIARC